MSHTGFVAAWMAAELRVGWPAVRRRATPAHRRGLHPWRNQAMPGPWITSLSASLYKTVPITERVKLRINLDAFNVLNQPGIGLPDSTTGILSLRTSGQAARVLQYGARLSW